MVEAARKMQVPTAASTAVALNGGEAVAHALRQVEPEVVAAYPITPQTLIIEKFAEFVAEGKVRTEFVTVESEHAALSACVGASAAGARSVTATAGPGLALMFEMLGVTSGMRLPVVMHLCTRALSAPLNILEDHSDAMAMRETGWVMISGASPQEAYDLAIVSHLIGEHPDVRLPVAHLVDGFAVTHAVERVDILPDGAVREFAGEYAPETSLLTPGAAMTYGAMDFRDYYYEHHRQQQDALDQALPVTVSALEKFGRLSGRSYSIIEPYRLGDAQIALVYMGSADGAMRAAADAARRRGVRVGALRIRLLRPFPARAVADLLRNIPVAGVFDRAMGFGSAANPLMADVMGSLWDSGNRPLLKNFVYGLGGRVLTQRMLEGAIEELLLSQETGAVSPRAACLGLRQGGAQ
jgi:pyruvate ferredoxin oxidoreductase alpha subunit